MSLPIHFDIFRIPGEGWYITVSSPVPGLTEDAPDVGPFPTEAAARSYISAFMEAEGAPEYDGDPPVEH